MACSRLRGVVGALLLMIGLAACQGKNGVTQGAWTGFLEGPKVDVAAQVGGRLTQVLVEEGAAVQQGQTLAGIEDDLIRLRIAKADANIAAAQAQLALLQAGATPEEIQRAEAKLAQASAALIAATQAVTDTEAIRANPQALQIQRAAAAARAQSGAKQFDAAVLQAQAADAQNQFWEQLVRMMWGGADIALPGGGSMHFETPQNKANYAQGEWQKAGNAAWQAWARVTQAEASAKGAEAALKDAESQLANPIALDARVNQAKAARDRAAANLQAAQAALQALKEGPSAAQLQAAQAAVEQARAARATLDQELTHYQVRAPSGGIVQTVYYRAGEVVGAMTPIIRLSVPGDLTLMVYVPMSGLQNIHVGSSLPVRVEGLSGRSYTGTVRRIADRAEFTGRQPQTDSERNAQLVAVEIAVGSTDSAIKAGMPATVSIGE